VRIDGAVVLVTGASSGIGAAAVPALAARGARVLAAGRDPAATERVATAAGAVPLLADLAADLGPVALAGQATAVHGHVDVLVHSAGIGWKGALAEMPASAVDGLLAVNLRAPIALTRALLPGMLARGHGRVVLIASIAGLTGVASESVYAATKAGLVIFAESLRLEISGSGVGVSVVSPGAVATPFFDRRGVPYDRRMPRPISPEAVVRAVLNALEKDRDEQVVPAWLGVAPRVRALAPGLYRRLARRFG
jgi:short-subunit dehydrogenase